MAVEAIQLDFNCRECDAVIRGERGCTGKGIIPFEVDGERIFRCPLRMVSDVSWKYIEAYTFYRKSLLPNGGSYLMESQKYIDAMFVLDREYAKIEKSEMEKLKQ